MEEFSLPIHASPELAGAIDIIVMPVGSGSWENGDGEKRSTPASVPVQTLPLAAKLAQHERRRHGAVLDRRRQAQDVVPVRTHMLESPRQS